MSRTIQWVVAVSAFVGLTGLSKAAFTLTAQPSAQAAPAGKRALDLFVQNDLDPTDGVNILGASLNFTGANGTHVFFASSDAGDGTFTVDPFNFGRTTGTSNTILVPGASSLRIGDRQYGTHFFAAYPDGLTPAQATIGLSSFQADYVVLGSVNAAPGLIAPGARVARFVFDTASPAFTINGRFAGEVGPVSAASLTVVPEPTTLAALGVASLGLIRRRR